MTDFRQALRTGLEAAERADFARQEIDNVFRELNEQVMSVSGGKLLIERKLMKPPPRTPLGNLAETFLGPRKRRHFAIVASNPTISEGTEQPIADWSQDDAGYPCSVAWSGREHICEDRESLSNSLEELLKDPGVAHTLSKLMKAPPNEPEQVAPE
jgi:hypothetical protein